MEKIAIIPERFRDGFDLFPFRHYLITDHGKEQNKKEKEKDHHDKILENNHYNN